MDLTDDKSKSIQAKVPSGNKPLPKPMLTKFCVAKWRHQATIFNKKRLIHNNELSSFNINEQSFIPNKKL